MYEAEISRANPCCIVILVDQSGSMNDPWGTSQYRKASGVASVLNNLLRTLVIRCAKGPEIRDYFYVSVIGFGGHGVRPAFQGRLQGMTLVPISMVGKNPVRVVTKGKTKYPIWVEPVASGTTPMCGALRMAIQIITDWIQKHPNSYPPIVFNITDGAATDGDPQPIAEELKSMRTTDGNVLLFNIHISSAKADPIVFPNTERGLPNEFAVQLFRMASILPKKMVTLAKEYKYDVHKNSRGFVFNADMAMVIKFFDIGTRAPMSGELRE